MYILIFWRCINDSRELWMRLISSSILLSPKFTLCVTLYFKKCITNNISYVCLQNRELKIKYEMLLNEHSNIVERTIVINCFKRARERI